MVGDGRLSWHGGGRNGLRPYSDWMRALADDALRQPRTSPDAYGATLPAGLYRGSGTRAEVVRGVDGGNAKSMAARHLTARYAQRAA